MKKKLLSDFTLEYIVYLKVGSHNGETLEDIIKRKCKEVEHCGESLWAFSSGISQTVKSLCEQWQDNHGNVYAVFIDGGEDKGGDGNIMHYYEKNSQIVSIPENIYVTASNKTDSALVIEEYFQIDGENIIFTNEYDNKNKNHYIRGFGFLNKIGTEKKNAKKVAYIVKLKPPFIVKVIS